MQKTSLKIIKEQKNKILIFFTYYKNDDAEVYKKEFYACKQAITLDLVNIDKIIISDKFKHSHNGSKYCISYIDDNIIRTLCIILPQMSGYVK